MLITRRVQNPVTGEAVVYGHAYGRFTVGLKDKNGEIFDLGSFEVGLGLEEQWRLRGDIPPFTPSIKPAKKPRR